MKSSQIDGQHRRAFNGMSIAHRRALHRAAMETGGMFRFGVSIIGLAILATACGASTASDQAGAIPSYEDFRASVPYSQELQSYIIENDIRASETELRDYYQTRIRAPRLQALEAAKADVAVKSDELAVMNVNNIDQKWSPATVQNLTYCVSTGFGANQATVISAMNTASAAWESAATVNFVYVSAQNSNCTNTNNNVVFNVRPFEFGDNNVLASAFFPSDPRSVREVLIDPSAFGSTDLLNATLKHELGHTLGFRHETGRQNTAAPGPGVCTWEDSNWRPLTNKDSSSIMSCAISSSTTLTASDINGAKCVYGPLTGCGFNGVMYRSHVQDLGWLPYVVNNDITGTVGQSRRMEAIKLHIEDAKPRGICYQAHVQNVGWQPEVCDDAIAGTTGQGLQMEAIKIRLVGAPTGCTVSYQAHVANIGWQAVVGEGQQAGTTGQGLAIQALKVQLSPACL